MMRWPPLMPAGSVTEASRIPAPWVAGGNCTLIVWPGVAPCGTVTRIAVARLASATDCRTASSHCVLSLADLHSMKHRCRPLPGLMAMMCRPEYLSGGWTRLISCFPRSMLNLMLPLTGLPSPWSASSLKADRPGPLRITHRVLNVSPFCLTSSRPCSLGICGTLTYVVYVTAAICASIPGPGSGAGSCARPAPFLSCALTDETPDFDGRYPFSLKV